jgi:tRNA nucleotidyltransferase (CCA-adding enzyme)
MEVITSHINADFDAMASMIAAKKLYPDAVLVFPGSQERTLREFFVKSTVYLYDFKRLRDIDLEEVHRLILVDTRQLSRIGKFAEIIGRPGLEVHIYDHHPDSEDDIAGQLTVIKSVGANVTTLTRIIRERGIQITAEEATIISLGLFEDTGSFTFNSTTPEDFEAGAYLRRCGANLNIVADMVTQELTAEQITLLNELILSARTYNVHGIDVCISSISVEKYVGDFAILVHKLRDIENLDVVFALARMDDRIYLVARSRIPEVNVGAIAAHFGGGGHPNAASASIRDLTLIQAEDQLMQVLRSKIKPFPTSENLMTSPVIFVEADSTIGETARTMVRYNINALPIMENHRIVGLINRQVVEKSVFHGLESRQVRELMTTDFATVGREATLLEIQTHLVDNQQRILPVMDGDTVLGVITRRDLLNFLVSDHSVTPRALYDDPGETHWPKRKNINGVIMEQLPHEIIRMLKELGKLAERMKFKAYAVGGFTRDLLLRRPNLDIDIVVEGDGIEFARAFAAEHGIRARCHKKFNTAVLIFPNELRVDVATARFEYYQYPAALPIVEFGSLKMDLYRRDFTINTLAIALNPGSFGQLIDFFGGQRDLKERNIRVLHNLSFVEDPTRVLRAIRFEQRFGFRIAKQTGTLIRNAVRMGLLEKLGGHRLFHEIQLILMEDDPSPALKRMAEYEVLSGLSANLRFELKMEELFTRLREVISWFRLSFLDEPLEPWWVYFLGLLSGQPRQELDEIFTRLDLNTIQRQSAHWAYVRVEDLLGSFFLLPDHRPSDIYRAFQGMKPEELLYMMGRTQRETVRRAIGQYFHHYRHARTEHKGRDLKAMGIAPGPIYRKLLQELLDARLNGVIKNRQEELSHLRKHHPDLFKDIQNGVSRVSA